MPNGSSGESSRKKHKDQEVCVRVCLGEKFITTLPICPTYFQLILSQLSYSDGVHDPLERTPRRRDPPTWLKENPDYEVEGDMLEVRSTLEWFLNALQTKLIVPFKTSFPPQLLVNRSKRKRRRRADKALTGTEKVKIINMRTGKKVTRSKYLSC